MRDDAESSMRYRADKGIHDKKSEIEDTRIRNLIDSSYAVDGQAMRVSYGSFLLIKLFYYSHVIESASFVTCIHRQQYK